MPTPSLAMMRQRSRGDRRGIGAAAERLERRRPDRGARLRDVLAVVLACTPVSRPPRIVSPHSTKRCATRPSTRRKPSNSTLPAPRPEAEDQAAVGDVVEHRDLLGRPHRVVPRQHHHHRAQLHALGAPRHVGEELQDVRAHRVVGEVVLDAPDRLEAERLGQVGQRAARCDRPRGRVSALAGFWNTAAIPTCMEGSSAGLPHGKRAFTRRKA